MFLYDITYSRYLNFMIHIFIQLSSTFPGLLWSTAVAISMLVDPPESTLNMSNLESCDLIPLKE